MVCSINFEDILKFHLCFENVENNENYGKSISKRIFISENLKILNLRKFQFSNPFNFRIILENNKTFRNFNFPNVEEFYFL